MEIVDDDGHQMQEGKGKIIATSLYNFSLPFIRYDTGDIGYITGDKCGCGREYRLLKEVVGRQQEILQTPDGKYIHGEFFTHIFWEIEHVKEFQVIQETLDTIVIKIVPEEGFDEKSLEIIRKMIGERSRNWNIEFKLVNTIERTNAGKYKFVINKMGLGK
jgi:phenylacetate-CoA ligase